MSRAIKKPSTLIFDLDDTLYPKNSGLMREIAKRIAIYVESFFNCSSQEADHIRIKYRNLFGSSLVGLYYNHNMDPRAYADFIYDVDYSAYISKDNALISFLEKAPQRKVIYTNGAGRHARAVLNVLGIKHFFDDIIAIEHTNYYSKPMEKSFQAMFELTKIDPMEAIFFDDQEKNLMAAAKYGMETILVAEESVNGIKSINKVSEFDLKLLI